ncbi:MAG: hypothetical protein KDB16_13125, partial [Acidimicrobiales bacterium]|nr:hypothetical protein [Acidimicrobiales bacterium]
VLAGRYPLEPVWAEVEYFVIDIECASCVETFWGPPTLASLYGPDVEAKPGAFDVNGFEPCPSWRDDVLGPPPGLERQVESAVGQVTSAVHKCDARQLRHEVPGFADPQPSDWVGMASLLEAGPRIFGGIPFWSVVGPDDRIWTMQPYDDSVSFGRMSIEVGHATDAGTVSATTQADLDAAEAVSSLAQRGEFRAGAFAESVDLYLGFAEHKNVSRSELEAAAAWDFSAEDFAGYVGPFSALRSLARADEYEISVGPHFHCASPPRPAPSPNVGMRRVSIRPASIDSCLSWFAVDLFVDAEGLIRAVSLDLYEP